MERGFSISTSYGEIEIPAEYAKAFVDLTNKVLLKQRDSVQGFPMSNNANKTTVPAQLRLCSSPLLEELAVSLLSSPSFKMIESRFRATDRNLTIRLRPHEVPR